MRGRIETLADPAALAHHVAEWMTEAALAANGIFRVSLSGGSTPKALFTLLASDQFLGRFPWTRVAWYWGYERTLQMAYGAAVLDPARPLFDITLLGLGPDGHTASLLPGEPVLEERQRWVAAVSHGRPEVRITMTYPVIESSRQVAFLVAGKEKAAIFKAIRAGGSDVPAARVNPVGELVWFVDRAAAGES